MLDILTPQLKSSSFPWRQWAQGHSLQEQRHSAITTQTVYDGHAGLCLRTQGRAVRSVLMVWEVLEQAAAPQATGQAINPLRTGMFSLVKEKGLQQLISTLTDADILQVGFYAVQCSLADKLISLQNQHQIISKHFSLDGCLSGSSFRRWRWNTRHVSMIVGGGHIS